jgi:hypothetical protein
MKLTPDFEADIRTKVNPLYANQRGTESYERAALLGEIDRLRAAIQHTLDDNVHLADGENCTLIVLKRALGIQQCKKCGADMQPGVAMGQTMTGIPDFIGGEVCTVSPGGPGKLIECSKCQECGWSVTI